MRSHGLTACVTVGRVFPGKAEPTGSSLYLDVGDYRWRIRRARHLLGF